MATVTVNYPGGVRGAVVEVAGVGHAVNGYANDFPGLDSDVVAGVAPDGALDALSAGDRLEAVIEQLERDAESYRASDGHGTDDRAGEIDAVVAGYRAELDAL